MQITPAIVALQFLGHKPNSKTPRVTPIRGAPSFPYAPVYLQQWYPLIDGTRQVEQQETTRATRPLVCMGYVVWCFIAWGCTAQKTSEAGN